MSEHAILTFSGYRDSWRAMFSSIGNTEEYLSGAIAPASPRLFLPRRHCEHSIILASCESNSLLVFLTHTFSTCTLPFRRHCMRSLCYYPLRC